MPVPVWADGQVLPAADVNNWAVPIAAYKTADLGRTSTTRTADPDLTVAVAAGATYQAAGVLFWKTTALTASLQWSWAIPAGSGAGLYHAHYVNTSIVIVTEADYWGDTHTGGAANTGTVIPVKINGTLAVGGAAGTLTLNWAVSGSGGTVTLSARSHLILQRTG